MESPMGYRNSQIVEELAAEGKITTEHKGVQTFDFAQYSLLKRMAETTADWPLDKAAEEKAHAAPHIHLRLALNRNRLGNDHSAND